MLMCPIREERRGGRRHSHKYTHSSANRMTSLQSQNMAVPLNPETHTACPEMQPLQNGKEGAQVYRPASLWGRGLVGPGGGDIFLLWPCYRCSGRILSGGKRRKRETKPTSAESLMAPRVMTDPVASPHSEHICHFTENCQVWS